MKQERPAVDLGVIQRQLDAITKYLKANVWKGKHADSSKEEDRRQEAQ